MRLVNAAHIERVWRQMATDPTLVGILIRHADKEQNAPPRGGLSQRGRQQVHLYAAAIVHPFREVFSRGFLMFTSDTERNQDTLVGISSNLIREQDLFFPKELNLPFMGPNDEDSTAARTLAKQHGRTVKEMYYRLEEYGVERRGENPKDAERRIREYLIAQTRENRRFVYSLNSPVGNEALGVIGSMDELEVAFLGWYYDHFSPIGRIAPEWEEVAD